MLNPNIDCESLNAIRWKSKSSYLKHLNSILSSYFLKDIIKWKSKIMISYRKIVYILLESYRKIVYVLLES